MNAAGDNKGAGVVAQASSSPSLPAAGPAQAPPADDLRRFADWLDAHPREIVGYVGVILDASTREDMVRLAAALGDGTLAATGRIRSQSGSVGSGWPPRICASGTPAALLPVTRRVVVARDQPEDAALVAKDLCSLPIRSVTRVCNADLDPDLSPAPDADTDGTLPAEPGQLLADGADRPSERESQGVSQPPADAPDALVEAPPHESRAPDTRTAAWSAATPRSYRVHARCQNCCVTTLLQVSRGKQVTGVECPCCGCRALEPSRSAPPPPVPRVSTDGCDGGLL